MSELKDSPYLSSDQLNEAKQIENSCQLTLDDFF